MSHLIPAPSAARWLARLLLTLLAWGGGDLAMAGSPGVDFTRDVQPIFQARCVECHGPEKQRGGLRLDTPDALRKGGSSGAIVVARKSGNSPLLHHLTAQKGAKRMPPRGEPLSPQQIAMVKAWIDGGATLPTTKETMKTTTSEDQGWAFQPIRKHPIPRIAPDHAGWVRNPVDAFIGEKFLAAGLRPSPAAEPRILARRVYLDLTGLPPTPEEMSRFLADSSPHAYEKLVDELLASPRYGERWARHWLDVAHYADSHGQDQDRPRPNAWPYRDYLIRAFNQDRPYGRFLREQIAGDVLFPTDPQAVVATGFLAAGPWDESGLRDINENSADRLVAQYLDRDDIVTSVMTTFAGLTVHCARCHDHKFDPITQADYFGLQAVFAGIDKAERKFDPDPEMGIRRERLTAELARLRGMKGKADPSLLSREFQALATSFEQTWRKGEDAWRTPEPDSWIADSGSSLKALLDRSILAVGPRPERDTYTITFRHGPGKLAALRLEVLPDDTLPKQGPGRTDNGNLHLSEIHILSHPVGKPGEAKALPIRSASADFNQEGWGIARSIDKDKTTAWGIYPEVGKHHQAVFLLAQPLEVREETMIRVVLEQLHGGGHLLGRFRLSVASEAPGPASQPLPTEIRRLLERSPEKRGEVERAELARWLTEIRLTQELAALPPPQAVYCGTNRFAPEGSFRPVTKPRPIHILHRGETTRPGKLAEPGSIQGVANLPGRFTLAHPDDEGERRTALASWLDHPTNPLTWRVIVNRIWHYHFGRGIVDTPNDFGKMGGIPSHPELLDWLASTFRDEGASLKRLHRLILTSATYRQAVRHDPEATRIDANNRLLWRMNRGRLEAESVRDAMLHVTGRLEEVMYGPPVQHFLMRPGIHVTPVADYDQFDVDAPGASRRGIYRYIFRTRPDPMLEALDCPDASQSAPVRGVSISAPQALVLWNNKFNLRQAEHLAALAERSSERLEDRVRLAAERVWCRSPRPEEADAMMAYARTHGLANLCRVLFNSSEFLFID